MPPGVAYVELLGSPRAQLESWVEFLPERRYQLLAYLAYQSDWVSRDKLAYLFWPDASSKRARNNLRQLLKRLRELTWLSDLETDSYRIRWQIKTDVAALKRALEEGKLDEVLSLYRGPLLEGLGGDDATEFSSWLALEREHLHTLWRESLLRRAEELEELRRYEQVASLYRSLLEEDELDEEALKAYMKAAFCAGERNQALKTYRSFAQRLHQELELEPTSSTVRLAQAIQEEDAGALEQHGLSQVATAPTEALPLAATPFVGRDAELSEIMRLFATADCRLVTVTGPGGVGKTRIALQAARELAPSFKGSVYFVALESLRSPEHIISSVAQVLALDRQGQDLKQVLRHLKERRALLVLDNFEHLLEGSGLLSELLRNCPELNLLVTSREALNLQQEWRLPIEGLPFPSSDVSLERALSFDAVRLFVQGAKRVQPRFSLTEKDSPFVLAICRIVAGLPLGIELASTWVRMMPCEEIAKEINDLDFLATGARDVAERHRSLRAVFEHSWRLLSPKEQEALRKLSVFQGGFTREAAVVVAGASVAILAALVDKSLLGVGANGRYDYHSLLHQYAAKKLAEDEEAQLRARHGSYFLALAEETRAKLRSIKDVAPLNRLEQEHDNLRAALSWALEEAHDATALRLAAALGQFWEIRGHLSEGRRWLEAALARQEAPAAARAKALIALGRLTLLQSGAKEAEPFLEAGLKLWRRLGDKTSMADALNHLGIVALGQHDFERAEALYREGLALYREVGDEEGVAILLNNFGELARCQQDFARASSFYEESLGLLRKAEDKRGVALVLGNLGSVVQHQGDSKQAELLLKESLTLKHGFGDEIGLSYCFAGLAEVWASQGDLTRAARLLGVTQALLERTGHHLDAADRADFERSQSAVRAQLGETTFTAAWGEGQAMSLEEAMAYALEKPGL